MEEPRRWNVTYTRHIVQKRKVYQDGMLELTGLKNKVLLYDDNHKLLESRFLKKDETVVSGGCLSFNSYIVDVGDCKEKGKSLPDLVVKSLDEKTCIKSQNNSHKLSEWTVLYTTQITQKSKKYHDGFLQLMGSGSHTMQVILLSEDRSILSNKYLKSVDHLKTGITIEVPNYLVQICELHNSQEEDLKNSLPNNISVYNSTIRKVPVKRVWQEKKVKCEDESKKRLPMQTGVANGSTISKIPCNAVNHMNGPFRDVSQILCCLQNIEERHSLQSPSKHVRASKIPCSSDAQNEDETSSPMVQEAKYLKEVPVFSYKVDQEKFNENALLCASTIKDINMELPDSYYKEKPDSSLISASLSSGPLVSVTGLHSSMNSESTQETLIVMSMPSEDYCASVESHVSANATRGVSCGARGEISNEHAVGEELSTVSSQVGMLSSSGCSTNVAALASDSSLDLKNQGPLDRDDIPSFDLGF